MKIIGRIFYKIVVFREFRMMLATWYNIEVKLSSTKISVLVEAQLLDAALI